MEWRLYNLHRAAVKAEGRRQAGAGPTGSADIPSAAPKSPTAIYDPVREASQTMQQ